MCCEELQQSWKCNKYYGSWVATQQNIQSNPVSLHSCCRYKGCSDVTQEIPLKYTGVPLPHYWWGRNFSSTTQEMSLKGCWWDRDIWWCHTGGTSTLLPLRQCQSTSRRGRFSAWCQAKDYSHCQKETETTLPAARVCLEGYKTQKNCWLCQRGWREEKTLLREKRGRAKQIDRRHLWG